MICHRSHSRFGWLKAETDCMMECEKPIASRLRASRRTTTSSMTQSVSRHWVARYRHPKNQSVDDDGSTRIPQLCPKLCWELSIIPQSKLCEGRFCVGCSLFTSRPSIRWLWRNCGEFKWKCLMNLSLRFSHTLFFSLSMWIFWFWETFNLEWYSNKFCAIFA